MALISFRLDVYHHVPQPPGIPALITERLDKIMDTQLELLDKIKAVTAIAASTKSVIAKIGAETEATLAIVEDLKLALAQCQVSPEVAAAMADLEAHVVHIKAEADGVDAKVPDAVEPEPAPE